MCATGALLNILGPLLEARGARGHESREGLGRLLACVLSLSIIERCI
jgi:hypothetical protein